MDDEPGDGTQDVHLNLDELEGPDWHLDWDDLPEQFDVGHVGAMTVSQLRELEAADLTELQRESLGRAQKEFFEHINASVQSAVGGSFKGLGLSSAITDPFDSGKIVKTMAGVLGMPNFTSALMPTLGGLGGLGIKLPPLTTPALNPFADLGKDLNIPGQILGGLDPAVSIGSLHIGPGLPQQWTRQFSMGTLAAGAVRQAGLAQTLSALASSQLQISGASPNWLRIAKPEFVRATASVAAPSYLEIGYAALRASGAWRQYLDPQLQAAAREFETTSQTVLPADEAAQVAGPVVVEQAERIVREGVEWALRAGDWFASPRGKWIFKGTVFVLVFETTFAILAGIWGPPVALGLALGIASLAMVQGYEAATDFFPGDNG